MEGKSTYCSTQLNLISSFPMATSPRKSDINQLPKNPFSLSGFQKKTGSFSGPLFSFEAIESDVSWPQQISGFSVTLVERVRVRSQGGVFRQQGKRICFF